MRTFAHLVILALLWLPVVWQLDAFWWLGDLYENKQIHPYHKVSYQPIYYVIYMCGMVRGVLYLLAFGAWPNMFYLKRWLPWCLMLFELSILADYHFYFGQTPYRVEISVLYTLLLTGHYLGFYWKKFYK